MNMSVEESTQGRAIGVRVRFMGDLRAVVESRDLEMSLPRGSSVGDLLSSLAERYGDPFAKWVFTGSGDLHHYIVIFVNGDNLQDIGGLSAKLGERDDRVEIIMLPMFEGG
ncbi:MAG: MoaD/ThiS family protein [Deltaproteobacteria bacterium]|nr:MoaD/ThiS family protein [Deltaproteobacteria bacterium]